MKRCPACSRVYDDDNLRFCLDDGTSLVEKLAETVAPPTLAFPENLPVPTIKQAFRPDVPPVLNVYEQPAAPSVTRKRSVLPWLLAIGALLLLGSSIVVAVIMLSPKPPLNWHLTLEIERETPNREAATKQTVKIIETRLNALGVSNFEVKPGSESGRIFVNLPGVADPERIKRVITEGGKLELAHVISPPSPAPFQAYATREEAVAASNSGGTVPSNRRVLPYSEREEPGSGSQKTTKWVVVESPAIVDGSELRNAAATSGRSGDDYSIQFSLKTSGAAKFGAWTGANINEYLGVILNDEVKSIAFIKSQISDQGEISGRFTKQSAEDLALVLKTGALPAPVKLVAETVDKP